MKTYAIQVALLFTISFTGCSSFSTTPITRLDCDNIVGDSNGNPKWFQKNRAYRGVPIKVKVHTHVDVWIDEEFLFYKGEKHENWAQKPLPHRFYKVRTEPVVSDQIVISDFKRPASGLIDLTVDFTDEQYIDKIISEVQDSTITDSAALLSTIITKTGISKSSAEFRQQSFDQNTRYSWETRTVAYQRFDINAPDFEYQVEHFVNKHLNDCNQCNGMPTYDANAKFQHPIAPTAISRGMVHQ